jgi:hypothetical protein
VIEKIGANPNQSTIYTSSYKGQQKIHVENHIQIQKPSTNVATLKAGDHSLL